MDSLKIALKYCCCEECGGLMGFASWEMMMESGRVARLFLFVGGANGLADNEWGCGVDYGFSVFALKGYL